LSLRIANQLRITVVMYERHIHMLIHYSQDDRRLRRIRRVYCSRTTIVIQGVGLMNTKPGQRV
jgi:hypothetical protein